jgi:hypothetical protein
MTLFLNAKYEYCIAPVTTIPPVIVIAKSSLQSMYVHTKKLFLSCVFIPYGQYLGFKQKVLFRHRESNSAYLSHDVIVSDV